MTKQEIKVGARVSFSCNKEGASYLEQRRISGQVGTIIAITYNDFAIKWDAISTPLNRFGLEIDGNQYFKLYIPDDMS